MKVLMYRGKSILSKVIQFQTRSVYSHVAIETSSGVIIEAWPESSSNTGIIGGVRMLDNRHQGHSKGTLVDVYDFNGVIDTAKANDWLVRQVGKKYDYRSVFRFLTRVPASDNDKWFCSELAFTYFEKGGVKLLNEIEAHNVAPRDIPLSVLLNRSGSFTV